MIGLTVNDIAAITGGRLHGGNGDTPVTAVVIDSRAAAPGALFAALPGERADGHDYISRALDAGAACCLALRVSEGETRCVITVADVAAALCGLASHYRRMFDIPVVGVTGSVGKTTAKEMIACVLSQKFCTLKTEKNFNNELGVPLTLFRLGREHEAAVIEMGISHFGEMKRLAAMAQPTMAVYTVIGRAHLEFLGDRAGVLRAKGEMLETMSADGVVFVNGDDDLLSEMSCRQRKITFGMNAGCDIRATGISPRGSSGMSCDIVIGDRRIPVVIPSYARHMVYAALAAAAVGVQLGR
jgi:UDP-N-acetylmuramoyl-tripeptide--D-alanyl-D-alanine ligase